MDERHRDRRAHYVVVGPNSPREARELVRRAANEAHWCGDLDGAVLSASEIVANAIRHTGAVARVEVTASEDLLRVEARDDESGGLDPQMPGPDAVSGRGLAIVVELSDSWGVRPNPGDGKTVWFEMAAPAPHSGDGRVRPDGVR